ncbi:aromatic ring-hydroxylating dioxygenase subunit alpha [SAR92 clade bacterium H231]|jgi:phenylpropionate dioxygenase-like ring-hydroxylating dioxygenase large terminal subunit|nr:aromatic ring-hydroxylating dioxygenase subunit alpha [Porticoccaceae bacterium]MCT2533562.1 aromatic ring-hydroxylating dioxygenase subunit alpha [SAR92 clade bacterium H231]MDA8978768.1 aromatic ring-hydroxylating dioxygenase subunit alpha [bacterium]MBT6318823.1 aromatic ring-hydroxylating dioxygenase subunit alpha [Porticoccaceae bacterium]MBT7257891.1 aromatic ring-hydroxylating dioxygenase subunit alpha [Porticoccaceae bacterium]
MKIIATDILDNREKMTAMASAQLEKPGFAINPYFYRSHVTYEAELEHIVFKSWLYAGHISQVAKNGDYFLFDVGEDSIIISRDNKGQIGAMHNICRHRGARVCEEPSGNRKAFICPYHGWAYGNDGHLKSAREMDQLEGFKCEDYALKKVRFVVFQGMIFINCDPNAPDFIAPLENISRQLGAYDLENAKVAERKTYRINANWKLVLENYLECYHCSSSHRQYAKLHTLEAPSEKVKPINQAMWARAEELTGVAGIAEEYYGYYNDATAFGACSYTSRYALYEGFKTGSRDGQPVAPLMGNMQGYDGGAGDFQMGPLTFMLNYPDHCVLYRFIPRNLTETDMEVVWYVNGDAVEGVDYEVEKVTWLWHHTSLEDEYIILRNNEGVNSRFFEPGPYHPEYEATLMEFISWYLKALSSA